MKFKITRTGHIRHLKFVVSLSLSESVYGGGFLMDSHVRGHLQSTVEWDLKKGKTSCWRFSYGLSASL